MSGRTPVHPTVRTYWRALSDLDEARADAWLQSIYDLAAKENTAAPRRLERLVPALDFWCMWSTRIGQECGSHSDRSTVGVHHIDIICHPLVMKHVVDVKLHVGTRYGGPSKRAMMAHGQAIVSRLGDQGPSIVRREARGETYMTDSQWARYWERARNSVYPLLELIADLIGVEPGECEGAL